jgi:hypothetical protein
LWQLKKFSCHPENSDDKMVIESFQSPYLVPFQLQQGWVTKNIWSAFFCGNKEFQSPFNTHNIKWQTNIFGHQKRKTGHEYFFPKMIAQAPTPFGRHPRHWMAIEKNWLISCTSIPFDFLIAQEGR